MKKLAVLLLGLSTSALVAQGTGTLEQGRWVTSGIFCYDTENDKQTNPSGTSEDSWTTGKVSIYGGYSFAENQVAGLGVGYESNVYKNMFTPADPIFGGFQDDVDRTGTFSITPFYRYYKWCSDEFAFVGTAKVPIGFTSQSSEFLTNPNDPDQGTTTVESPSQTSLGVWIVPTFMWMPDENWSIEAGIGQLGFTSSSFSEGGVENSTFQFSGKIDLFSPMFIFSYYW